MKQQYEEQFLDSFEPPKSDKPYWVAMGISLFWLIMLFVSLQSCSTSRRIAKACKTLDAHPKEGAKYCGDRYKPTEKVTTKIQYKPGKPYPVPGETQYVTVDCDSVNKVALKQGTPKIVKVPVPTYLQVDTAAITTDIERENVAKLADMQNTIDDLKAAYHSEFDSLGKAYIKVSVDRDNEKAEKKTWKTHATITWLIVALAGAVWLFGKWLKSKFKL